MYDIFSRGGTVWVVYRNKKNSHPEIMISTDAGKKWTQRTISRSFEGSPVSVAVNPDNTGILYAGGSKRSGGNRGFLFKSVDGGKNWQEIAGSIDKNYVNDVCIEPENAQSLYCSTDRGIYHSGNAGETWSKVFGERCESLYITRDGTVYAAGLSGIYRSGKDGNNWELLVKSAVLEGRARQRQRFRTVIVDEKNNILYASSDKGLIRIEM